MLASAFHKSEHMQEILGDVMVLLEEQHHPGMIPRHRQPIKHAIRLPPPVMFGLRELGFSIVAIQVRVLGVGAF